MKDFLSVKEKIVTLRDFGVVHCYFTPRDNRDMQQSISKFATEHGFLLTAKLEHVDHETAIKIMRLLLTRDLAYNSILMLDTQADELINAFCNLFDNDAQFFTNGYLSNTNSLSSWNPITAATFDTGVFILDTKSIGCLWVEDED